MKLGNEVIIKDFSANLCLGDIKKTIISKERGDKNENIKKQKAFTLVELIVVIAIIGILSAVLIQV